MAGTLRSLFNTLRGKNRKGPAAAPAQQPQEPEHLQPLQDDAGKDRPQEQDTGRGRLHRAVQVLRRLLRIRRRKTRAAATEGTAGPDSRLSELQAEPGASAASPARAAKSARAAAEGRAEAGRARTESVATTIALTQAISKTGPRPTRTAVSAPPLELFQQSGGIRGLCHHLVEQLAERDGEMVSVTLSVLARMVQEKDLKIPSATALKLAEPLLWHFDNDNSHVQLLSIQLFCKVMELVVEEGRKALTGTVSQSLFPLFLHWHDKNRRVAEASCEALLCAARFLRRRDLEEPLSEKRRMKFAERLLLDDESRAAEHLRWALPSLRSPRERLRRAAVRFIGVAGMLVIGHKEELQVLTEALEALREDKSPSFISHFIQLKFSTRSAELHRLDQYKQCPSATPGSED